MTTIANPFLRQLAGTSIFVRTFSSVMSFRRDHESGRARLRLAGWHQHGHVQNGYGCSDSDLIAWFDDHAWHVARRHETAYFDPALDRAAASAVFGTPSATFVIPTTILVPLEGTATTAGRPVRCQRVYPTPAVPAFERSIRGETVEFRICMAECDQREQIYAEANMGGGRTNAAGEPRRAVYLGDHRLAPKVPSATLVAGTLMYLPRFIRDAGFMVDPEGKRGDLPRVGAYGVLPLHRSLYADVSWPASTQTTLLAFDGSKHHRLVQTPTEVSAVISEVDEALSQGHLVRWQAPGPRKTDPVGSFSATLDRLLRHRSRGP